MSLEGFLTDSAVRRQVFMVRYSNGEVRRVLDIVEQLKRDILGIVNSYDIDNTAQIDLLLSDYNKALDRALDEINESITGVAFTVADIESEFLLTTLNEAAIAQVSAPKESLVRNLLLSQALTASDPDNVLTLNEAIEKFAGNKRRELINIVDEGLLAGKSLPQISKDIREIFDNRIRHQVDTLTRTVVNFASNVAKTASYTENSGIIKGYEWVATLDARTTLLCAGRDGRFYPIGSDIRPPAHWNCRSTTIAAFKDDQGEEGLKGKKPPDFDQWLRKQSSSFVDEYFSQFKDGAEKARLFKIGKLPIQKFRNELGASYTLEELRQLDPVAFDRANIDVAGGG